ncbi:MAG: Rpn family recombination-promoting nuclease/putative transposase [Gemmatimonadetes bacterium]|nr:Rpn family recombination-promoting nuclease/putative transposase [Gemmatimonadota bacterium]MYD13421.1 Rpn family recombination-promoting nuclease/putative transposase [Gemmatimonadota bacterium]MYI66483.1 Rpn family recombination-promoting nuclease/putative transposase [Gemmatimonadota bacterium]
MPGKREPPLSPKHDASYKSFFARRRTVVDTLRAFASDIAAHLDFATLERMPASFVTRALDQRHADMLWRVQTTGGRWLYILILLEFQSTVDRRMALRMMEYTAAIWKRLEADDLGPGGEYPFLLPVVIYNGEHRWTATTDVGDLLAPAPDELLGYLPRHRYLLIEIQAEDPAALPPDNVLSMIARFEQAPTAAALEELVRSLPDWLTRIRLPEFEEPFMAWVTRVLTQRHGDGGRDLQRKLRIEEETRMTTLIERARQWGKERDEEWLEKGIERGRTEGERELARRLARDRFGPGAAQELSRVLDESPGAAEVPGIVKLIFECETAEEFLRRVREA